MEYITTDVRAEELKAKTKQQQCEIFLCPFPRFRSEPALKIAAFQLSCTRWHSYYVLIGY